MTKPLLISVAPNGARLQKEQHSSVPLTADELALEARRCLEAGARLFHLHVRDDEGQHSLCSELYLRTIDTILNEVGDQLILQITTENAGVYSVASQMATVRSVMPQAASFAVREFFGNCVESSEVIDFFCWVQGTNILSQFIVYNLAELVYFKNLLAKNIIQAPKPHVLFVLGAYNQSTVSDPAVLVDFLREWGSLGPWSVCAFGQSELKVMACAIALGGHVRVGFENNILAPNGRVMLSSSEQVRRVSELAKIIGRRLASVESAACFGC